MKTKAISSIFVLFAIAAGMASMAPAAYADHAEVSIITVDESGFSQTCAESQGGTGCYIPFVATVDVGGVVTMTNTDPTGVHTYTSGTVDGFAPSPDGIFDTGVLMSGDAFEWTPTQAGEQPYYCMLHTWMIGTIIVQEAAAEEHADDHGDDKMDHGDDMVHEDVAEDVELMVMISDSQVMGGTQIELEFNVLHLNYDLTATQNGEVVFEETGLHSMDLIATHQIDAVGSDENPISVEVVSLGIGAPGNEGEWTGPIGQVTTAQVVPEFGTIAMMVLAVAIISIVAVTAKSRVVPRF
ncbi:PEFG-CTERM sorting domain-containing protein [Nitrosopumilus sp.]|jgi:predicted secreted protein with PEFG-CTERM motif|nr:PEFG-CTERM sorting domain-containing protein [Nitrosopumilus sp.]